MSSLSRELVFLVLQFLDEEKFKESVHRLEKESAFFFNMKYFEEKVQAGDWDEVENYLSGFTKVDDNRYSMKIFFEIRKQKYLEALDRHDKAKALHVLVDDLKVLSSFNEELFKEMTQLLTLSNFRENEQLSKYGDIRSARRVTSIELKKLIEANPLFHGKLAFPTLKSSRLRTLINQSLNWQHQLCKNPRPNPDIKTLFTDHSCQPPNGSLAPTPVNLPVAAVAKPASYTSLGTQNPFPPAAVAASANALAGWMVDASASSSVQEAVVTESSTPVPQNQEAERQRKEEAERNAKLDEIAEIQRQREQELDEKERLRREAFLVRSFDGASKPYEPPVRASEPGTGAPAALAAAAAPARGKYVYVPPSQRSRKTEVANARQSPPPQSEERWDSIARRGEASGQAAPPENDSGRWRSSRWTEGGIGLAPPETDRWIAEIQRQRERELDEKERLRREAFLVRSFDGASKPYEPPVRASEPGTGAPAASAAAAAPARGKYVYVPPSQRTRKTEVANARQSPPPQSEERWDSSARRREASGQAAPPENDSGRWRSSRWTEGGNGLAPPETDRWGRPDDRAGPTRESSRRGGSSGGSSSCLPDLIDLLTQL